MRRRQKALAVVADPPGVDVDGRPAVRTLETRCDRTRRVGRAAERPELGESSRSPGRVPAGVGRSQVHQRRGLDLQRDRVALPSAVGRRHRDSRRHQSVVVLDRASRQQAGNVFTQLFENAVREQTKNRSQVPSLHSQLHVDERFGRVALEELEVDRGVRGQSCVHGVEAVCSVSPWPQLVQKRDVAALRVPQLGHFTCAVPAEATSPAPRFNPAPMTAGPPAPPPFAAPSPMPSIASPAAAAWKEPASLVYCTSRRYFFRACSSSGLIEMVKLPMRATSRPYPASTVPAPSITSCSMSALWAAMPRIGQASALMWPTTAWRNTLSSWSRIQSVIWSLLSRSLVPTRLTMSLSGEAAFSE